jgi:hypothetical protein
MLWFGYFLLVLLSSTSAEEKTTTETLYNGIQLPSEWPPRYAWVPTREPMMVPYLYNIPEVIPIDVGRQLFVDDFLIEPNTLVRTYHQTEYYPGNPILKPDQPWETGPTSQNHPAPTAMVFSDGVWYDPSDQLYKMWYMGGYTKSTCYATSRDGIAWEKPKLDVVPGTNIVSEAGRDSTTIWLDPVDPDPARRFKLFAFLSHEDAGGLSLFYSADGIHWSDRVTKSGPTGDRSTAFYNPFREVWVYSIKTSSFDRRRKYSEHPDPVAGAQWKEDEAPLWVGADRLDTWWPEYNRHPQLYNLDCVAYESVLLGLFSIWPGPGGGGRPKPNQVFVGFSRDGFHWYRPDRKPFIPISNEEGSWNYGNVQSAGGCCLVVGDRLYFYVSGRTGVPGSNSPASGTSSTGLATLRRDGFVSMDSIDGERQLTTRPVTFKGRYLFTNFALPEGELRVEVLDERREPLEPFTYANSIPVSGDSTLQRIQWHGAESLEKLKGKPVRFRFHLKNGSLYSFWVSPDESGASYGFVAAGGPGFTGPMDTVGNTTQLKTNQE